MSIFMRLRLGRMTAPGFAAVLCWALLSGCSQTATRGSADKPADRDVSPQRRPHRLIEASPAAEKRKSIRKIVSLMPSTTEMVYFVGAGDRLAGRSEFCNHPPEAKRVPVVGGFYNPNVEIVTSLKPDLVLSAEMRNHPAYKQMIDLGLPLLDYTPQGMEDVLDMLRDLAERLGTERTAGPKLAALEERLAALRSRRDRRAERPTVFVEIWDDPLQTLGGRSYINAMLETFGARNLFADVDDDYPKVTEESVLQRNPDVILFAYMTPDRAKAEAAVRRPGWASIRAVREGRWFVDIDPDLYLRAGPRMVDGAEAIEAALFPERKGSASHP